MLVKPSSYLLPTLMGCNSVIKRPGAIYIFSIYFSLPDLLQYTCISVFFLREINYNKFHVFSIVGNPLVILINSLFHHLWVHLVTFACFQSNMHNLCDLFLPNEIKCYVCMLLFSFGFSE